MFHSRRRARQIAATRAHRNHDPGHRFHESGSRLRRTALDGYPQISAHDRRRHEGVTKGSRPLSGSWVETVTFPPETGLPAAQVADHYPRATKR